MDTTEQLTISFCSGYGGLDRGIELAGVTVRTVAYVEIEAYAVANLVAKMEQGHLVPAPVWTNLKTFPMEKFRGRVHGITAGYPCQPFSVAGKRGGAYDPRHLWPFIKRTVSVIQPHWCFFENVEGHVTLGLSTVISDLEEMGYSVEAGLFSAAEVGAPHRRKRIFILAHSLILGRGGRNQSGAKIRKCEVPQDQVTGSNSLGNSTNIRLRGHRQVTGDTGQNESRKKRGVCKPTETSTPLANNNNFNAQWEWVDDDPQRWKNSDGSARLCCGTKWPAGPNSSQYDWEAPRVVEPQVGGKPYGAYTRVDELRLLGNGVVPQQAARAWRVLSERMNHENNR